MIEFEVYSDDPDVVELVEKYWATDQNGKYRNNVTKLLPFRDIKTSNKLLSFINNESSAWNSDNLCASCQAPLDVRSRSDRTAKKLIKPELCDYCKEQKEAARVAKAAQEEIALAKAIEDASQNASISAIEYGQIPDDIAFVLLALDKAIRPKLTEGFFRFCDAQRLTVGPADPLLKRLYRANAIRDYPAKAEPGAYWLEDDSLWFKWVKAQFFLVPDKTYGATEDALAYLDNRPWNQYDLMRSLWLDYAVDECLTYFFGQCGRYSLSPASADIDHITSQIRSALDQYSIKELWCALWTIVKDAAALCNHEFYNVTKATATMPGKLQRLLEAVRKNQRQPLRAWYRPQHQPAGMLGELFYERYGLNEETPGDVAARIFSNPTPPAYDPFMESEIVQKGLIDEIVERIHHHQLGAPSFSIFAAGIRVGLSTEEAIAKMLHDLPRLQKKIGEAS